MVKGRSAAKEIDNPMVLENIHFGTRIQYSLALLTPPLLRPLFTEYFFLVVGGMKRHRRISYGKW
jgi:hypothetical protein